MNGLSEALSRISLIEALVIALGAAGLLWYFFCLFSVGLKPTPAGGSPSAFRQFESLSISTIGVSLSTFVGGLIGLNQAKDQNLSVDQLQWACAILYVLSLLIAIAFWRRGEDKVDPAIISLGKSLLGLVGGALAIALGTQS